MLEKFSVETLELNSLNDIIFKLVNFLQNKVMFT